MCFKEKAERLVDKCNISSEDRILLPGCAYGWLGESLVSQTGCQVLGLEPSSYIQETKNLSGNEDILEAIRGSSKCNFTEKEGVGKEIWDKFRDDSPRSSIPILHHDLSKKSDVLDLLSLDFNPTLIITEELYNAVTEEVRRSIEEHLSNYFPETRVFNVIEGSII